MRAQRERDTAIERALRRELHRRGLRFRLHRRLLPDSRREADIVLPKHRLVVFVDGCFWHGCPQHASWPKRNYHFWKDKIEANQRRDADTVERLELAGWRVVRIWEHEEAAEAADKVQRLVGSDVCVAA